MAGLGSSLSGLLPVAMTAVGLVTILRARRSRRGNRDDDRDGAAERRRAAEETQRRMASYMAQRDDTVGAGGKAPGQDRRENGP